MEALLCLLFTIPPGTPAFIPPGGLPPITDLQGWPTPEVVRIHTKEALYFLTNKTNEYNYTPAQRHEAYIRWDVWDDLRLAQLHGNTHSLANLKKKLGDEAYYSKWLPNPIPYHLFPERK